MPVQTLPSSAEAYQRAQQREIAATILAVRSAWRRMGADFDPSWLTVGPQVTRAVEESQLRVAAGAAAYIPAVLEETGQRRAVASVADVVPEAFVGAAGDGRPVDTLTYGAVVQSRAAVAGGATVAQALSVGREWLTKAVGTVLSDTGRAAEKVGMAVRPVGGYVRMLNPPSCSRCAVLAGAFYRSSTPFRRHFLCDCRHIPAAESVAGDLAVDVDAYFESLPAAEQDRIFTKAGAEAIREGADINQVVNARRGMNTATTASGRRVLAPVRIGGQDVFITRESITRRGSASIARTGRRGGRLMPETIQQVATDKDDFIRLLRANGYVR